MAPLQSKTKTLTGNVKYMTTRGLIIYSVGIPVLFVCSLLIRDVLEHYFRFSEKYKDIYAWGATGCIGMGLALGVVSCVMAFNIYRNRKDVPLKLRIFCIAASGSVGLLFIVGFAIITVKIIIDSLM